MTRAEKQRQAQVSVIIQNAVYGWQIPMMKIPEIYRAGEMAAIGRDGSIDETAIRAAVTARLERLAVRS